MIFLYFFPTEHPPADRAREAVMAKRFWTVPFVLFFGALIYSFGCGQNPAGPDSYDVEPQYAKGGGGPERAEPNPIGCTQDQIARWDATSSTWVCAQGPFGQSCASGHVTGFTAEGQIICSDDPVSPEVCDGLDNDGDGLVDEDFPNLGQLCDGADADFCAEGVYACTPDGLGTMCSDDTADNEEICGNGVDDNCDGQIDEGCDLCATQDCSDGYACTDDQCISSPGSWSCTNTPMDSYCDDGLACTVNVCDLGTEGTGCSYTIQANSCLIDGACYGLDDPNPSNPDQICDPNADPEGWTNVGTGLQGNRP